MTNADNEKLNQSLTRLKLVNESERISFTRAKRDGSKCIVIYYDALTDEQKQELERIDQALLAMADHATEDISRTLKDSPTGRTHI